MAILQGIATDIYQEPLLHGLDPRRYLQIGSLVAVITLGMLAGTVDPSVWIPTAHLMVTVCSLRWAPTTIPSWATVCNYSFWSTMVVRPIRHQVASSFLSVLVVNDNQIWTINMVVNDGQWWTIMVSIWTSNFSNKFTMIVHHWPSLPIEKCEKSGTETRRSWLHLVLHLLEFMAGWSWFIINHG